VQQVSQKLMHSEIINSDRAKTVLTDVLIKNASEEQLKQSLKKIFVLIGLRQQHFPFGDEKDFIHNFIFDNYGNKTLSELELAFNLAIKGELDIELNDVKVYDQFTPLYVSTVMGGYRKWLNTVSENQKFIAKEKVLKIEDRKELTPIEMIDWIEEWRNKPIVHLDLIPLCFYDFLVTTDMIQVSKEMKWDYVGKAATAIKTQLLAALPECKTTDARIEYSEFERMEKEGFTGKFKERINNKAKRLIVFDYLKK